MPHLWKKSQLRLKNFQSNVHRIGNEQIRLTAGLVQAGSLTGAGLRLLFHGSCRIVGNIMNTQMISNIFENTFIQ